MDYSSRSIAETTSLITREKAIEKALSLFNSAFNIKIDRIVMLESVRLYKEYVNDPYRWQISWSNSAVNAEYICIIDSSSGDILTIGYNVNAAVEQDGRYNLTFDELNNIITPFLTKLGLDGRNLELVIDKKQSVALADATYAYLTLSNRNNENEKLFIKIDCKNRSVAFFTKMNLR